MRYSVQRRSRFREKEDAFGLFHKSISGLRESRKDVYKAAEYLP